MSESGPPEGSDDLGLDAPVAPPAESLRAKVRSIGLFFLTLLSVFWVYGTQLRGGDPFSDATVASESAQFAVGLMAILLAHEMGHYIVARRHGFSLSLPYFIPFPAAFGTFGAIIRLRSLPRTRNALLEMGAAGPLAGFGVAALVLALGLSGTTEYELPRMVVDLTAEAPFLPPPEDPGWLERVLGWFTELPEQHEIPMVIMSNPPLMDGLSLLINGNVPGRYADLGPLAMAGWVGCLLTAINLLPIGQLDGGHVFNAIWPEKAPVLSKIGVCIAILAGVFWTGWAFWGLILLVLRAWMSLPVPISPGLSRRAIKVTACTVAAFFLCFMPMPIEFENYSMYEMDLVDPDGEPVTPKQLRDWLEPDGPLDDSELEPSESRR